MVRPEETVTAAGDAVWNVPNVITMARLVLSAVVCVLIPAGLYLPALVVFLIAAGTDWIDGWWARRFHQITKLGRVLDPFCDKVLICGAFILIAEASRDRLPWYAAITGWMAVVVVARELLVTALRSMVEGAGGDFSAKMAGKLKMWFQCIAAAIALYGLACLPELPFWFLPAATAANWLALVLTLWSGWGYIAASRSGR